jgi:hypothetical protein
MPVVGFPNNVIVCSNAIFQKVNGFKADKLQIIICFHVPESRMWKRDPLDPRKVDPRSPDLSWNPDPRSQIPTPDISDPRVQEV